MAQVLVNVADEKLKALDAVLAKMKPIGNDPAFSREILIRVGVELVLERFRKTDIKEEFYKLAERNR